jgi:hypothetical protein
MALKEVNSDGGQTLVGGVRIRAHQLPGAGPLQLTALEDQAIDALATGTPGDQAPLHLSAIEVYARASFPLARSRAAPAMRCTRFKAQRPFEV